MTGGAVIPGPVRLLMLEDRAADAELMLHHLRAAGFEPDHLRVEDEASFTRELPNGWDLILSDFNLPTYDARRALEALRASGLGIPLIVVTGSIGEEEAVECMRLGASDYLLKDRLARLGSAVQRVLEAERARRRSLEVESQLRQSQKMESIGQLAGGIAHDFNNLLTVIGGYTELALHRPGLPAPAAADLNEVLAATKHARDLTQQILAFGRKQRLEKRVVDLNDVVGSTQGMLRRVIGEDIDIRARLTPGPLWVNADPTQIQQVLVNLAVNARDAMPGGGVLAIETGRGVENGNGFDRSAGRDAAILTVTDTGHGMSRETLARIFEPFFTTKPAGRGTGLGLATVFGIVEQHGGRITAASEPGRGTTMRVVLPRTEEEPASVPASPAAATGTGVTPATVLVVDDEPAIRELVVRLLARERHLVLQAESANEAERIAGAHPGPIDLLITDIVLPGRRGTELHRALRASHPRMEVLFMSGYAGGTPAGEAEEIAPEHFLRKPFDVDALNRAVSNLLARR